MFSTVYIKAHYFVDVVAGFISAPDCFFLTFKFYKFLNHNWMSVSIKEVKTREDLKTFIYLPEKNS